MSVIGAKITATAEKTVVIAGKTTAISGEIAEAAGTATGSAGVKGTSAGIVLRDDGESEVTAGRDTATAEAAVTTAVRIFGVIEDSTATVAKTSGTINGDVTINAQITAAREWIDVATGSIMPPVQTAGADSITNGTKEISPAGNTGTVGEGIAATNNKTV
jgi:hypothetical protein